jgi:hypothetical protein
VAGEVEVEELAVGHGLLPIMAAEGRDVSGNFYGGLVGEAGVEFLDGEEGAGAECGFLLGGEGIAEGVEDFGGELVEIGFALEGFVDAVPRGGGGVWCGAGQRWPGVWGRGMV